MDFPQILPPHNETHNIGSDNNNLDDRHRNNRYHCCVFCGRRFIHNIDRGHNNVVRTAYKEKKDRYC